MEDVIFENLIYTVARGNSQFGLRKEKLTVLKGISGHFKQGQLSAILGSSGAGKSSLLNIISGLRNSGVDGTVRCNKTSSCYITQEDLHQPFLTVQELMEFSCQIKLGHTNEMPSLIADVLNNLNLSHRKNFTADQLSGGERRRLSIALEYVANPSIFFLDEPTSGLDEVNAVQTVHQLKNLAIQNHTVVCTIHQPSATIFEMFDHIYVVAHGQCAYQGAPKALLPFLANANINCPTTYNPADFVIELFELDENRENNVRKLVDALDNGKKTCDIFDTVLRCAPLNTNVVVKDSHDRNGVSGFQQFVILFKMMMLKIYRNRITLYLQLTHYITCGLLFGLIYFQSGTKGNRMFDNIKFCWGVSLCFIYTQYIIPVISYPLELKLVKHEYLNRWYGLVPYYFAFSLSRVPLQICLAILFSALVYTLCGLPMELSRFTWFIFIGFITGLQAEGFGLFVGATFSVTNGTAVGPMFCIPLMAMATYGIDFASKISPAMKYFLNVSFVRNGFDAMLLTVFGNGRQKLSCPEIYCHFEDPKTILRYLNIHNNQMMYHLILLFAYLIFFRVLFFISLKYKFST